MFMIGYGYSLQISSAGLDGVWNTTTRLASPCPSHQLAPPRMQHSAGIWLSLLHAFGLYLLLLVASWGYAPLAYQTTPHVAISSTSPEPSTSGGAKYIGTRNVQPYPPREPKTGIVPVVYNYKVLVDGSRGLGLVAY